MQSLLAGIDGPLELPQLVQAVEKWRETAVHREDLPVDKRREGEPVEEVLEPRPELRAPQVRLNPRRPGQTSDLLAYLRQAPHRVVTRSLLESLLALGLKAIGRIDR